MHDAAFHRSARPTLAIKGLSKRFTIGEQTVEALRDVNLTISNSDDGWPVQDDITKHKH